VEYSLLLLNVCLGNLNALGAGDLKNSWAPGERIEVVEFSSLIWLLLDKC